MDERQLLVLQSDFLSQISTDLEFRVCLGLAPVFIDPESRQTFIPGLASLRDAHIYRKKLVIAQLRCLASVESGPNHALQSKSQPVSP
jgi:hypothetical protein